MDNLTIFAVAYKPKKELIEIIIKRFSKKYNIIIINNSLSKLNEEFYDINNLTIIDNIENNGNGAGINYGLKIIKTHYALYLDLDAYIDDKNLSKLLRYAQLIRNFGVLIPNSSNKNLINKITKTWDVEGSIMLFNIKLIKNKILFDEKYFLYFEEVDFFYNCIKQNINVYFLPKVISNHDNASSMIDSKSISKLRKWHYSWSQFYFYKKNFGIIVAIKKCLIFFIKNIIMLIPLILKGNFNKVGLRIASISGFLNSLICLKSWKRTH